MLHPWLGKVRDGAVEVWEALRWGEYFDGIELHVALFNMPSIFFIIMKFIRAILKHRNV